MLLIALWLRSYWIVDVIGRIDLRSSDRILTGLFSDEGTLAFDRKTLPPKNVPGHKDGWTHYTFEPKHDKVRRLGWEITSEQFAIKFPTWLPAIFLAGASLIPWMLFKWHFTLRTLLIATTLIAVTLGLICYAIR